ncbi:hypothetical protein AAVH_43266, partial [Aphelenchoides avenae]
DVAREVAAALADAPVKSAHPLVRHLRAARVPSGDLRPRKATDEPPTTIEPFKFLADRPYLDGLLNILGVNPRSFMKAIESRMKAVAKEAKEQDNDKKDHSPVAGPIPSDKQAAELDRAPHRMMRSLRMKPAVHT